MNFQQYQGLSKRTMPKEFNKLAICNYAMGLGGESGEVEDLLKKYVHHGHQLDIYDLESEIGDVLHYLAGLCTMFHLDLGEVAMKNVIKLEKRYPNGFSQEDSIKRVDKGLLFDEKV